MAQKSLYVVSLILCSVLYFNHAFSFSSLSTTAFSNNPCQDAVSNHCLKRDISKTFVMASKKLDEEVDQTTKKYGLEAGLFQAFKSDSKSQAQELLKKYGSAYLITSISFAIVSFSLCYFLVDNGVNVQALLEKVGITATQNTEAAGTFAIAYAAHKAASPIRFPPTVALTPVVANLIGKKNDEQESDSQ